MKRIPSIVAQLDLRHWNRNVKRLAVLLFLPVFLAALLFLTSPGRAALAVATNRQLPIYCVEKTDNVCSLTFDAAWADVRMRCIPGKISAAQD